MTKAAIFASGSGSNFEAIAKAGNLACEIALLVCDKAEAPVISKAEKLRIPALVLQPKEWETKAAYEERIQEELLKYKVEWIFLAGYMRLIGPTLLNAYEGRIINIHPSLLPDFKGKDAIGQALAAGVKQSGVTIHFVDAGMDTGRIIAQEAVPVKEEDTPITLQSRIQQVEHRLYPETINQLLAAAKED